MKAFKLKWLTLTTVLALSACGGSSTDGQDVSDTLPNNSGNAVTDDCIDCGWNINQWKLTLPVSQDDYYGTGGSSAAELIPAECSGKETLTNDTSLEYFWRETSPDELHFKVNLDEVGATTDNSSYVRSELRELRYFDTENRCSSSHQNWFITGEHQLSARLNIAQYPSITGVAPKVVLGQVHGYEIKQALVKLLWEGDDKPVRVILNDSFAQDNQTCSDCQSFSINLGVAKAYEQWQYRISVNKQGIELQTSVAGVDTIKTLKWGEAVLANDGNYYTLSKNWLNESYYFKAGIYPQIHVDSAYSNQVFEVGFSKITVTHQ
ncbi:polysaccharide lyase family 7 protein [Shewanella sp.]|uniref:polysaccharide lyase family 7 protein n=1 Tax=Shewanella sp. TaxID=50422 RepID=UPI0040477C95